MDSPTTVTEALRRFRSIVPKNDDHVADRCAAVGLTAPALSALGLFVDDGRLRVKGQDRSLASVDNLRIAGIDHPDLELILTQSTATLRSIIGAPLDHPHMPLQSAARLVRCIEGELMARSLDGAAAFPEANPPGPGLLHRVRCALNGTMSAAIHADAAVPGLTASMVCYRRAAGDVTVPGPVLFETRGGSFAVVRDGKVRVFAADALVEAALHLAQP